MGHISRQHPALASGALLFALLLTLLAPDHWGILPASTAAPPHGGGHANGESSAPGGHARHCHESASTCTDLPLASASGLALLEEWLAFGFVGPEHAVRAPNPDAFDGHVPNVETPPPRPPLRFA